MLGNRRIKPHIPARGPVIRLCTGCSALERPGPSLDMDAGPGRDPLLLHNSAQDLGLKSQDRLINNTRFLGCSLNLTLVRHTGASPLSTFLKLPLSRPFPEISSFVMCVFYLSLMSISGYLYKSK